MNLVSIREEFIGEVLGKTNDVKLYVVSGSKEVEMQEYVVVKSNGDLEQKTLNSEVLRNFFADSELSKMYLVVPDGYTNYRLKCKCPDCEDYQDWQVAASGSFDVEN